MPNTEQELLDNLDIFDSPEDYSIAPEEVKDQHERMITSMLLKKEDMPVLQGGPIVFNSQLKKLYVDSLDVDEYVPMTTPIELSATGALLGSKVGIILNHADAAEDMFVDQSTVVWNADIIPGLAPEDTDNYVELECISTTPFLVRFSLPGREPIRVDGIGRKQIQSSDSVNIGSGNQPKFSTQRKHIKLQTATSIVLEGDQSGTFVEAECTDGDIEVTLQVTDYDKYCWFEFKYTGNGTHDLVLKIYDDTSEFDAVFDESVTVDTPGNRKSISINTPGKHYVIAQQSDSAPLQWRVLEKKLPATAGVTTLPALTDVTITSPAENDTLYWNSVTSQWENGTGIRLISAANFAAGATGITAKQINFTKPVTKIGTPAAPFTSTGPLTISYTGAQDGSVTEVFWNCSADPLNPQPAGVKDIGYIFKASVLQRVVFRREGTDVLVYSEDLGDSLDALKSLTAYWDLSANFVSSEVPNSGAGSSALKLRVLSGSGLPTYDATNLEMDHDGVNDILEVYGGNVAASGASRTFGFVIKLDSGVSEQHLVSNNGCQIRVLSSGQIDAIRSGGTLSSASGIITFGTYMFLLVECTTTSTKVYKNNGTGGWTLLLSDGVNSANAAFGTGTPFGLTNTLQIKGSAKAFFAHAAILTDAERRRLGYQLAKKYQIAL
jgi:hypothetical protein